MQGRRSSILSERSVREATLRIPKGIIACIRPESRGGEVHDLTAEGIVIGEGLERHAQLGEVGSGQRFTTLEDDVRPEDRSPRYLGKAQLIADSIDTVRGVCVTLGLTTSAEVATGSG